MKKSKSKDERIKSIEYNLLGNAFLSNLFDMSGDLDNSGQNLVTYLESDEINKLNESLKMNNKK